MAGPTSPPRQSLAGVKNQPVPKYDCDARWAQPQRANSWSAELPRRLPNVRPSSCKLRRALGDRLAGVSCLMDPHPPSLRTGRASRLVKLTLGLTANQPDLKQPPPFRSGLAGNWAPGVGPGRLLSVQLALWLFRLRVVAVRPVRVMSAYSTLRNLRAAYLWPAGVD
jgi:hypothetical protein